MHCPNLHRTLFLKVATFWQPILQMHQRLLLQHTFDRLVNQGMLKKGNSMHPATPAASGCLLLLLLSCFKAASALLLAMHEQMGVKRTDETEGMQLDILNICKLLWYCRATSWNSVLQDLSFGCWKTTWSSTTFLCFSRILAWSFSILCNISQQAMEHHCQVVPGHLVVEGDCRIFTHSYSSAFLELKIKY